MTPNYLAIALTLNRGRRFSAEPRYLARFTSERQRSVVPMGVFIEGIQALYATDELFAGPLSLHGPLNSKRALLRRVAARTGVSDAVLSIRGLGLDLVDACGPVKVAFSHPFSLSMTHRLVSGVLIGVKLRNRLGPHSMR